MKTITHRVYSVVKVNEKKNKNNKHNKNHDVHYGTRVITLGSLLYVSRHKQIGQLFV